jgi:hypothetical protein
MGRRLTIMLLVWLSILGGACTSTRPNGGSTGDGLASPAGYGTFCAPIGVCPVLGGVPASLFRALHLPGVRRGGPCPISVAHRLDVRFGLGLGDGPIFAAGPIARGSLRFDYPPPASSLFHGSDWGGNEVRWVASPTYSGPVLIRGEQLDGPHAIGFTMGDPYTAYSDLQLSTGLSDVGPWRNWLSATRLRASGCYGYQIDGTNFSEVIVFSAVAR